MSSRKEDKERKEKMTSNPQSQDITPTESVTTTTTSGSSSNRGSSYNYGQRRQEEIEQQHSINRQGNAGGSTRISFEREEERERQF